MIDGSEHVRGTIIGDYYPVRAIPEYEGRVQGRMVECKTEKEAIEECKKQIKQLKAECGDAVDLVYPSNEWYVRIYD